MFRTGLMTTAAVAVVWGLTSGVVSAAETKKSDAQLCMSALASGGAETNADARLQKLDTDGNGFVSQEEFQNCLNDMFAKLDANADDRLSADELEKGHAGMMQQAGMKQQSAAADETKADAQLTTDTKAKADADQTKADTQTTADTKAKADADQTKADAQLTTDTTTTTNADETKADMQTTADTKTTADADKTELQTNDQTTAQTGVKETETGQPAVGTTDQAAVEPSQPLSEMRISAEELIGKSVANPSGEDLGEIEDLVIDPTNEDMFAVVGVGGFLGLGEKKVTIPYNELQMSPDNDKVIVMTAQTKDQLKEMPEYEQDRFRPVRDQ